MTQQFNHSSAPAALQTTQQWFAGTITHRLGKKNQIQHRSSHGSLIAEEAARYVVPSANLRPAERIQIYNQQYWWRLLSTLHTNFPLVTRLFGYQAFNEEIGIPYLIKCPPTHWSLLAVGQQLPDWIKAHYLKPDKLLISHAAQLDWTFAISFVALQQPALDLSFLTQSSQEDLLSHVFYLQPHVHLLQWSYDLLIFREAFMQQEVDYWLKNRFPQLVKGKTYSFMLYRTFKNQIGWRQISLEEFTFLSLFKSGTNLAKAFEWMEEQDQKLSETIASHLQQWLQEWVQLGLLTSQGTSVQT